VEGKIFDRVCIPLRPTVGDFIRIGWVKEHHGKEDISDYHRDYGRRVW
jgi:hypothetical protein